MMKHSYNTKPKMVRGVYFLETMVTYAFSGVNKLI